MRQQKLQLPMDVSAAMTEMLRPCVATRCAATIAEPPSLAVL